jgi:hypothetical protein|tara:strand:- start:136 stop:324 length:189 start_codon:yes stop_codon:yes gene_type:complete
MMPTVEELRAKIKEAEGMRLQLLANANFAAGKQEVYEEMLADLLNGHKEGMDGNDDSPEPTA